MGMLDAALPAEWGWGRLGDFFEVTRKPRSLQLSEHEATVFIPMEAIAQDGAYSPRYETRAVAELTSGTYFEKGDLLVAKITPSFENGKQALVADCPNDFGFATTEVIPLRSKEAHYRLRLLFFYLLHPEVRSYIAERMEGSTARQRVPEPVLLELPFPRVSAGEQAAMADVLEGIVTARLLQRRAERIAIRLKNSVMDSVFAFGLRNEERKESEIGPIPKSWSLRPLGSLGKVGSGTTPNRTDPRYWNEGTVPWITSGRMYEREITGSAEKVTTEAIRDARLPMLSPGALLMAIVGQGKTLGHCAILRVAATVSRHVGFVQPDGNAISSEYLRGFLESRYELLRQLAAGNGSTRAALTGAILRSVTVPVPPTLEEQNEIVAVLDAVDHRIDLHRQRAALLDELFKTTLHELITGQIRVADLDTSAIADGSLVEMA